MACFTFLVIVLKITSIYFPYHLHFWCMCLIIEFRVGE